MDPATRLDSVDVLRGITIAGMIVVNDPGTWSAVYPQLLHAEWNGWTYTDTIFPFFLFVAGVSMALSFGRRQAEGASTAELLRHTAVRAAAPRRDRSRSQPRRLSGPSPRAPAHPRGPPADRALRPRRRDHPTSRRRARRPRGRPRRCSSDTARCWRPDLSTRRATSRRESTAPSSAFIRGSRDGTPRGFSRRSPRSPRRSSACSRGIGSARALPCRARSAELAGRGRGRRGGGPRVGPRLPDQQEPLDARRTRCSCRGSRARASVSASRSWT